MYYYIKIEKDGKEGYFALKGNYYRAKEIYCVDLDQIEKAKPFNILGIAENAAKKLSDKFDIKILCLDAINNGRVLYRRISDAEGVREISFKDIYWNELMETIEDDVIFKAYTELTNDDLKIEETECLKQLLDSAQEIHLWSSKSSMKHLLEKEIVRRWIEMFN